jgi:hypothetical protein
MKPRARRSVSWILHSSSSVTESLYVERNGGGAEGSAMGMVWSTPGQCGGTYPEGMPRRTSLYDSRVEAMRPAWPASTPNSHEGLVSGISAARDVEVGES